MANFYAFYPPGSGGGSNASVGLNGTTAPTSSTEIGFINGSGNETAVSPSTPLPVTIESGFPAEQNVNLNEVGGAAYALGQNTMAASLSVAIASNQSTIPVADSAAETSLASILANQVNGTQKSQVVDGADATVGPVQGLSGTNYLPVVLTASATPGSATVARSIQVAGSDGTNARTLATDSTGKLNVNVSSSSTPPDYIVSGSLGALNAAITMSVSGISTGTLELQGTWVGTVVIEVSNDSGANWNLRKMFVGTALVNTGATTNGYYRIVGLGAYESIRARMSAYTSGSATANLVASAAADTVTAINTTAANLLASAWLFDGSGNAIASTAGALDVFNTSDGSVGAGAAASKSSLGGVVFNASLPTLTTGQQAAVQADSSGRTIISPLTNTSVVTSQAGTPAAKTVTQAAITVGTTAVRLTVSGSAPASTRVALVATPIQTSTANFFIGSSTVTNTGATAGVEIVSGQTFIANNDAGDYWIISSAASQTVLVMEQS